MKLLGKDASPQELIIGTIVHAPLFALSPWYIAAPVCVLSGLLWIAGGTFNKSIRRYGVPIVAYASQFPPQSLLYIAAPVIGVAVLSMGDGFPDRRPTTADAGSWLGRLVERVIPAPEIGGPATKFLAASLYMLTLVCYFI